MATGHRVSFAIPARDEDPAVLGATVAGVLATAPGCWREVIVIDAEVLRAQRPTVAPGLPHLDWRR